MYTFDVGYTFVTLQEGMQIMNRQRVLTLSSLVEGLK